MNAHLHHVYALKLWVDGHRDPMTAAAVGEALTAVARPPRDADEREAIADAHERLADHPDRHALDAIHDALNGTEWEASTLETVAAIVERSGRTIADPADAARGDA